MSWRPQAWLHCHLCSPSGLPAHGMASQTRLQPKILPRCSSMHESQATFPHCLSGMYGCLHGRGPKDEKVSTAVLKWNARSLCQVISPAKAKHQNAAARMSPVTRSPASRIGPRVYSLTQSQSGPISSQPGDVQLPCHSCLPLP